MEELRSAQFKSLSGAERRFINALLSLMREKSYDSITISDLSNEAGYDRRTYYRYFQTKDDILKLYCYYLLKELIDILQSLEDLNFQSGTLGYFRFWQSHLDLLFLLRNHKLLHTLGDLQESMLYQFVEAKVSDQSLPLSQYAFCYTAGGLWRVICYWVTSDPIATPEELTEYVMKAMQSLTAGGE